MAEWLIIWLTPLWVLGLGALLGLLVLLALWGLVWIVSQPAAVTIWSWFSQGPLVPICWVAVAFAGFGIVGAPLAADRAGLIASLARTPFVGTTIREVTVPAASGEQARAAAVSVPVRFRGSELREVEIESTGRVIVTTPPDDKGEAAASWEVEAGEKLSWRPPVDSPMVLSDTEFANLMATNRGDSDAQVRVKLTTSAIHPQAASILVTAVSLVAVFLCYALLRAVFPKASAIALATAKSEMAQPLFLLLIGLGLFLLGLFLFIPYHTFGEDIKVLKDSGLTLIMVFAIFQAVWSASDSVSEEIEGRTAMTVLSKPVSRRQFILGKFLGIGWTSAVLFVVLGAWLLVIVAYKPIYDARETANTDPTWQACHTEVVRTVPGLVLSFLEALVFAAISVAIATRLPLLANFVICFAIYAFGHLTPLLVQAGEGRFETVRFMGRFIATVLPVLDHFNIQAAVAAGATVPYSYLGLATLYCILYCSIAMLLALALFEDRDLA